MTILLIENDQPLSQMYASILTKEGYTVRTAKDGVEGLEKTRRGGFALILLDLMMPNMNGIEFLHALRDNPPQQDNGPIIILSNVGYDSVAKEVMELGAKEFLVKVDLLPKDLVAAVRKHTHK